MLYELGRRKALYKFWMSLATELQISSFYSISCLYTIMSSLILGQLSQVTIQLVLPCLSFFVMKFDPIEFAVFWEAWFCMWPISFIRIQTPSNFCL
jgi:hypothetical protein